MMRVPERFVSEWSGQATLRKGNLCRDQSHRREQTTRGTERAKSQKAMSD